MAEFLEERLPIDVKQGASYADEYAVEITTTRSGAENRRLLHPFPVRHFTLTYTTTTADLWARVLAVYHRAYGMYAGFRVKCRDDYSTNAGTGAPTATDEPALRLSAGVYQLQNFDGTNGSRLASLGAPMRTIYKPVSGTTRVASGGVEISSAYWSVSTTNGQVAFAANKSFTITAITKAAAAVLTVGAHTFAVGESVYISGVAGMTQINGLRAGITATTGTTITVSINSTGFTTYTGGGTAQTQPQAAETVTAGCQFDLPCRFNSRIDVVSNDRYIRDSGTIDIIELIAP